MKRLFFVVVVLFISRSLNAQTYEQAIDLFKANKRNEAIKALKALQQSGSRVTEASLALTIIETNNENYLGAFHDFEVFFKNHPDPYPYVYALYNTGIFASGASAKNKDVEDFLRRLTEDPKANTTVKSCAINLLGSKLEQQGDFKGAKNVYAELHDVSNWGTLGEFENLSGSGFNKDFGAVDHPEADHQFKNKTGANVQWFDIPEVRNDRWWDLTYNHYTDDAVIYCQTFIKSNEDKEVLLMAGVSGSIKIWLNDMPVGGEAEERNTDQDVYNYRVKLQKGNNRLLLQTGSSEIDRNNFMVRIADTTGNLLTDINSTSHYEPYIKAAPYAVKQVPLFAEQYFQHDVALHPDDLMSRVMLLLVYNHNEKKYEAHKTVAQLKKMAPVSTYISQLVIETAVIDHNVIDANREREFIKTNDPESDLGIGLKFAEAINKENYDDAMTLLDRKAALYGETADILNERMEIMGKRKEMDKVVNEAGDAYNKFPDDERIVEIMYYLTLNQAKDVKKAKGILNKYLENNYSERIYELATLGNTKGSSGSKTEMLKQEISLKPVAIGKYLKLASAYYDLHEYDQALEWEMKAMKLSPYIGKYYYFAGLVYAVKEEKEKAIEMMHKAIYYSPTNYEAREKLRTLEGKKKLLDYFAQNDVAKLYKDAQSNEKYAREEAVVLLNDKREIVYPENGAVEEQDEMLVYINSQSAIQVFKEYYIQHNAYSQKLIVESAELLKKDGSKVPAEGQKGYLVFSSLGIGDCIHLYYKLENSYEGKLAEHFWNEMYLKTIYPTQTVRYSLVIPANKKFNYKFSEEDITPAITPIEDYKLYTWEKNNVPKLSPEPEMLETAFEKLTVSSIPDWNYVANWYSDLSNIKTKADFEVKEKVQELMAGNQGKTELEKARIIYEYIENNYNYSNVPFLHSAFTPQRASRTLSTKLGDCKDLATLFVSMTREAGLNTNLVLVRTHTAGDDNLALPSIAFNHCIAQLHAGGKDYLVELTNNELPFTTVGPGLINANGLYIPKDGANVSNAQLVKLNSPNRPLNESVRNASLTFKDAGARVHRVVYKTGADAADTRYYFKDADPDEQVKKLTESVNTEFKKNVRIENLKIANLNNLSDTIKLDYDVIVDNFTSEIVGMKVFRMPWTDYHFSEHLFSLDKRNYPMELGFYSNSPLLKETITVTLPAGKKLAEIPKDVTLNCAAFDYKLKYEVKGDKISATREMRFLKDIIMPEEYIAIKEVVAKINQADTKDIAWK